MRSRSLVRLSPQLVMPEISNAGRRARAVEIAGGLAPPLEDVARAQQLAPRRLIIESFGVRADCSSSSDGKSSNSRDQRPIPS